MDDLKKLPIKSKLMTVGQFREDGILNLNYYCGMKRAPNKAKTSKRPAVQKSPDNPLKREGTVGNATGSISNSVNQEVNMKRGPGFIPSDAVLKPYVSKRKRKLPKSGGGFHTDNEGETGRTGETIVGSKIFTLNPTVASCIRRKAAACKLPRQRSQSYHLHTKAVTSLGWNNPQYSHLLLTSSLDSTVRVWDCFSGKRCVRTIDCHQKGVKAAVWTSDGESILGGGFGKTVKLTDAQYNKTFQEFDHSSFITCLGLCPSDPQLFLAGTDGSAVYCWDMRIGEIVHEYTRKGQLGQILALEFIPGRDEFLMSCDFVCRNSDDRNIMVVDMRTTAILSSQIYHEKYTCPALRAHPDGSIFVAQSNANYAAIFSTQAPYRLNRRKRFEGHQVEGFQIGCDISPDGSVFASGSSNGTLYFYNFHSSDVIKTIPAYESASTNIRFHPVLGNMAASCSWDGQVTVWT